MQPAKGKGSPAYALIQQQLVGDLALFCSKTNVLASSSHTWISCEVQYDVVAPTCRQHYVHQARYQGFPFYHLLNFQLDNAQGLRLLRQHTTKS